MAQLKMPSKAKGKPGTTPFMVVRFHLDGEVKPHKSSPLKQALIAQGYPHGAISDEDIQSLLASPHQSHVKIAIFTDIARVQTERALEILQQQAFVLQQMQKDLERRLLDEIEYSNSRLSRLNPNDQMALENLIQQEQALLRELDKLKKEQKQIAEAIIATQKELVKINQELMALQSSYATRRAAVVEKYKAKAVEIKAKHEEKKKKVRAKVLKAIVKKVKIGKAAEEKLLAGYDPDKVAKEHKEATGDKKVAYTVVIKRVREHARHDEKARARLAKMEDHDVAREFYEEVGLQHTVVYGALQHDERYKPTAESDAMSQAMQLLLHLGNEFDDDQAQRGALDRLYEETLQQNEREKQHEVQKVDQDLDKLAKLKQRFDQGNGRLRLLERRQQANGKKVMRLNSDLEECKAGRQQVFTPPARRRMRKPTRPLQDRYDPDKQSNYRGRGD